MAKASAKKTTETAEKAPVVRKPSAKKVTSPADLIEKTCQAALAKLKELNAEPQLQADIEWCLGSYSYDKNPVGLFQVAKRSLEVFKEMQAKKVKGVTAKFTGDMEKALATA